jgi:hypothetical protein
LSGWKVRKTHEQFLEEMKIHHPDITVLGTYETRTTKIKVKCDVCEYEWYATPGDLISKKSGCPLCARKRVAEKRKKTNEQFVKELELVNPNIEPLSEYSKNIDTVTCRCKVCGLIWNTSTANNLLQGHGCPKCGNVYKKSTSDFVEELKNVNKNIEVLGEYKGNKTPIECKCKICGSTWSAKPNNLLNGTGCPICKESKGERRIADYLDSRNINYKRYYTYDGLVGLRNKPLSYDFYLPNFNTLIEFQGGFHDGNATGSYKQTDKDKLYQLEHDRRKRVYAMNHHINLIEIWYYDFDNIETILRQRIA